MTQQPVSSTPSSSDSAPAAGPQVDGGGAAIPTTDSAGGALGDQASIVDTILDLDEFLSGDVRRAAKTVAFSTRPDLEAQIDALELELSRKVDATGRPLPVNDGALAGPDRSHAAVIADYDRVRAEYDASLRSVHVEALGDDAFDDFKRTHPALNGDDTPERVAAFDALIVACARQPTFTPEKLDAFRKRVGQPVMVQLANACWYVNTQAGVSVPKSRLFSAAQKHAERAKS